MTYPKYVIKRLLDQDGIDSLLIDVSQDRWELRTNNAGLQWKNKLDPDKYAWLYKGAEKFMFKVNKQNWRMKLTHLEELRVCRYLPGFYHDWHGDFSPYDRSKLSLSCLLTPHSQFTGGDFEITEIGAVESKPGQAVVFPGAWVHRVTRVEAGERMILLGWMEGPRFR